METVARTLAILLMLIISTISPASAQTDSADELFSLLDGLETAHGRFTSFDFSDPADVDPSAMWMMLGIYTFAFDSEDAAAAAIGPLSENGPIIGMAEQMDGAQIEEATLDLDVTHTALAVESDDDGVTWTTMQVMVQDGELVYMVFGMAGGLDPAGMFVTLLTGLLDTDASTDAEVFNADGTSTGGVWEKFPSVAEIQADAPELTDVEDQFVETSVVGTPAA